MGELTKWVNKNKSPSTAGARMAAALSTQRRQGCVDSNVI